MDLISIIMLIAGIGVIIVGLVISRTTSNISDIVIYGFGVFFCVFMFFISAVLIACSFVWNSSVKVQEILESESVESYKDGAALYINGRKEDSIDLKDVNLDNYDITVEKDKIYLKEE